MLEISLVLTVLLFSAQLIKIVDSQGPMQRFATAKCHHRKLSNKMIGMSKDEATILFSSSIVKDSKSYIKFLRCIFCHKMLIDYIDI